jgi:hypothetical protein
MDQGWPRFLTSMVISLGTWPGGGDDAGCDGTQFRREQDASGISSDGRMLPHEGLLGENDEAGTYSGCRWPVPRTILFDQHPVRVAAA